MDNVVGTAHVLDFARNVRILKDLSILVQMKHTSSKKVYYKENDRYNSTNPYSATKVGAEELVVAFENTWD